MGTGRKRIKIQQINDTAKRRVTLTKRRQGLIKKLSKLQELTGVPAFFGLFSSAGRVFDSGDPRVLLDFVGEDLEGWSVCRVNGNVVWRELEFDENTLDLDELTARINKLEEIRRKAGEQHADGYFLNLTGSADY